MRSGLNDVAVSAAGGLSSVLLTAAVGVLLAVMVVWWFWWERSCRARFVVACLGWLSAFGVVLLTLVAKIMAVSADSVTYSARCAINPSDWVQSLTMAHGAANVALTVPAALLLTWYYGRPGKVFSWAMVSVVGIEVAQTVFHLGVCEAGDVIAHGVGVVCGVVAGVVLCATRPLKQVDYAAASDDALMPLG